MTGDPVSLENLRDIVEPAPVSWWPPAPSWWFLFAVFFVISLVFFFRAWRKWHANAYRREASKELHDAKGADVAALSRTAWLEWLEQTAGTAVPPKVGTL